MCRFTMYMGPPIRLASLLVEPAHSLILQSAHATERAEPLNGDGFGVGWYAPELTDRPAVFRSITPAWNNANLRSLAEVVSSPCVMAHVRAATAGMPVAEENCHPFQHDGYLFMHNGHLGAFRSIRRTLLSGLSNDAFDAIRGNTDSEHLFALFLDEAVGCNTEEEDALAGCLNRAVWRAVDLVEELGGGHPSFLNLAVTDGHRGAACRFSNAVEGRPETLYLIRRGLYQPVAEGSPSRRQHERSESFVVSSERLTDDSTWTPVQPNHMVSFSRSGVVKTLRMDRGGLLPA